MILKREYLPLYLRDAEGIIILRQFKVGLGFGVKAGGGIAMVRDKKTGKWSAPSFMKGGEGSWGLQIGAQGIVHIFLLMNMGRDDGPYGT